MGNRKARDEVYMLLARTQKTAILFAIQRALHLVEVGEGSADPLERVLRVLLPHLHVLFATNQGYKAARVQALQWLEKQDEAFEEALDILYQETVNSVALTARTTAEHLRRDLAKQFISELNYAFISSERQYLATLGQEVKAVKAEVKEVNGTVQELQGRTTTLEEKVEALAPKPWTKGELDALPLDRVRSIAGFVREQRLRTRGDLAPAAPETKSGCIRYIVKHQ